MKSGGCMVENLEADNCHGEQSQHMVDDYKPKVWNRQYQNQDKKSTHPSICQRLGPQCSLCVENN